MLVIDISWLGAFECRCTVISVYWTSGSRGIIAPGVRVLEAAFELCFLILAYTYRRSPNDESGIFTGQIVRGPFVVLFLSFCCHCLFGHNFGAEYSSQSYFPVARALVLLHWRNLAAEIVICQCQVESRIQLSRS